MGGGRPQDALGLLLLQPPLWAALAGVALCTLGNLPLPSSISAMAAALAPANKPLMLLAAGMTLPRLEALLPLIRDQPKMVRHLEERASVFRGSRLEEILRKNTRFSQLRSLK